MIRIRSTAWPAASPPMPLTGHKLRLWYRKGMPTTLTEVEADKQEDCMLRTEGLVPGSRKRARIPGIGLLVVGAPLAVLFLASCGARQPSEPPMTEAILYGLVTDEAGTPVASFRTVFQDFDADCVRTITAPDTAIANDSSGRYRHVVFAQYGQCERFVIEPLAPAPLRPDTIILHGVPWRHSYPLDSLRVDGVLGQK